MPVKMELPTTSKLNPKAKEFLPRFSKTPLGSDIQNIFSGVKKERKSGRNEAEDFILMTKDMDQAAEQALKDVRAATARMLKKKIEDESSTALLNDKINAPFEKTKKVEKETPMLTHEKTTSPLEKEKNH